MLRPIGQWLIRLVTWDGVLPATIWSAPVLIQAILPQNRGAIELVAVVLPISAFLLRYHVGRKFIATNDCGAITRRFQMAALCFGIFLLVMFDAVMILTNVMPKGAFGPEDFLISAIFFAVYITSMAVAMFPGFPRSAIRSES